MRESNSTRAEQLVANPTEYDRIIEEYDTEVDAYSDLTSIASKQFDSFDEILEIHRIFLENNSKIERWLNRDIDRTIKNLVTKESKAGKTFPVTTLSDVTDTLAAYERIGVDTPDIATQIETILEALYDDNWRNAHNTVDELLDDIPSDLHGSKSVYLLARARAALALHPKTTPGHDGFTESPIIIESRRFKATTSPRDDRSAPSTTTECFENATNLNYESQRKRELYALAIHRDPSENDALTEYLYLTAKNDVEKYRHRDPNPSRGRLAVAQLQFDLLAHHDDNETVDANRQPWVESYYHIAQAMMQSTAGYESSRVNAPEMEFQSAAEAYQQAAEAIAPINTKRQLKYTSKAYRHEANATQDVERFGEIHNTAKQAFLEMDNEIAQEEYRELAQDLFRYHHYRELEAWVYAAFMESDFEQVAELYIDYHQVANAIPKITKKSGLVEACYLLAEGTQAFLREDLASAKYYFDRVSNTGTKGRFSISTDALKAHLWQTQRGKMVLSLMAYSLKDTPEQENGGLGTDISRSEPQADAQAD